MKGKLKKANELFESKINREVDRISSFNSNNCSNYQYRATSKFAGIDDNNTTNIREATN